MSKVTRFRANLTALAKRFEGNMEKAVKAYSKEFLVQVVQDTPKLSGAAANNWQTGLDSVPSGVIGPLGSKIPNSVPVQAIPKGLAAINDYRSGRTIYIVNNVPYISRLNRGWSNQAPAGFVELARSRARNTLNRIKLLE